MIKKNPSLRQAGFIFFIIAVILGVLLILVRAIPDLEAMMYGFIKYNYPSLPSLSCPVLMTQLDREPVTIRLRNPLDKTLRWLINAQFSTSSIIENEKQQLEQQPGESNILSWEVGKENIDLGNLILARVFISPSASLKMRESTCGTLVLNLPFKGGPVIYYTGLVLAPLFAIIGLWLWFHHREMSNPSVVSRSMWMRIVTIVIAVGIVASLLDLWFLALLTVILTMLMASVTLLLHRT